MALNLKKNGILTFFSKDPECHLLGKGLKDELRKIYEGDYRYCLVIASKFYVKILSPTDGSIIYETKYKCPKTNVTIELVESDREIRWRPCPECGKSKCKRNS